MTVVCVDFGLGAINLGTYYRAPTDTAEDFIEELDAKVFRIC